MPLLVLATIVLGLQAPPAAGDLPAPIEARAMPDWDARFRPDDGWIGGDGAYSVVVTPGRTLWLFSDTWVGKVRGGRRAEATMVNNTVGVQDGHGDRAKVRFVVRRGTDGKPAALIAPGDGRGWFWPQAAAVVDGKLYLFLAQVERIGEGSFGFRQVGQWLGVVANPLDDPTDWKVEQKKMPFVDFAGRRFLSFGAAVLRDGDDLYVYGTDEVQDGKSLPDKHMIVGRVKAASVADFAAWRFYRDGRWEPDHRGAGHLADGMANEFSVSLQPASKRYLAVYTDRGLSDRIMARSAPAPLGPWSVPVCLYQCPDMKGDKRIFCYAAKAHPSESAGDDLLVTYVANSTDFWHVAQDARLYWPRFVRVRWAMPR